MNRPLRTLFQIFCLTGIIAGLQVYFFPAATHGRGSQSPSFVEPGEKHLRNVRQLTSGGENAEAYWSFDGTRLIFQSTRDGHKADQIYIMEADGSSPHMISTGKGRCTCGYFFKGDRRVLFSSTHLDNPEPPPPPDRSHGYVWGVFPGYDIFTARADGSDRRRLTDTPGYDAEATVSPDGQRIVFTSLRDGDLNIYSMQTDGSDVRQLTDQLGYDGGAFYSPDSQMICYRAYHPSRPEEIDEYRELLKKNLVKPTKMEIFVMNADGSRKRQVTHNGAANFCPYFTPDGKRLIFSSNMDDPKGRNFDLYLIKLDGTGLERVTTHPSFDAFPMFSPEGKKLVWASNRNARVTGETNIFVADWVW
jgi:TolB protein